MKTRQGFVSNSSSSSFIINKKDLNSKQIEALKNLKEIVENNLEKLDPEGYFDDGWYISENDNSVSGYTTMNNFSITPFLEFIGVDLNKVELDEDD